MGLSDTEANEIITELIDLIFMPFSKIRDYCPNAICNKSRFNQFWTLLKDFEYEPNHNFKSLSKLAFSLYSIPLSEAGAERSFSKLKRRFTDRRNRTSQETMMNEIHVENAHKNKLNSNKDYSEIMWQLPYHKK